jgi:DNA (cytosine-5)-methyltransferase 1
MGQTYYNEFDEHVAAWLRNLMDAGLISPGVVDERSIVDVQADELVGFDRVHMFAGIGGWDLALQLAGWDPAEPVWTGSCPCQPFSKAGRHRGSDDERHLWPAFRDLIGERHPPVVIGEQTASTSGRSWFSGVRADLEALGYAVGAADLPAGGVGAPHMRQRLFWVAGRLGHADGAGLEGHGASGGSEPRPGEGGESAGPAGPWSEFDAIHCWDGKARRVERGSFPLAASVPGDMGPLLSRMEELGHDSKSARRIIREHNRNRALRLKGYGNSIIPNLAATFIKAYLKTRADRS